MPINKTFTPLTVEDQRILDNLPAVWEPHTLYAEGQQVVYGNMIYIFNATTTTGATFSLAEVSPAGAGSSSVVELFRGSLTVADSLPTGATTKNGYMWTFSDAGDFNGEAVEIGDILIAKQDSPASLADFAFIQRNTSGSSPMTGATPIAAGASGLVPAPNLAEDLLFLRGDASFSLSIPVWAAGVSYPANYVVQEGNSIYIRKTQGTSGATFDVAEQSAWHMISSYTPNWSATESYAIDDIVRHSGNIFRAKVASTGVDPLTDTVEASWVLIAAETVNGLRSLLESFGVIKSQLAIEANSGGLTIESSAGNLTYASGRDVKTTDYTAQGTILFDLYKQDGIVAAGTSLLDVANYDNSGTLTPLAASNDAGVWMVYANPNVANQFAVLYPQVNEATLAAAEDGAPSYSPNVPAAISNWTLVCAIAVRKDATDLSQATYATFFNADKFGNLSSKAVVPAMTGASIDGTLGGQGGSVPAPLAGRNTSFLRGDGTYSLNIPAWEANTYYRAGTVILDGVQLYKRTVDGLSGASDRDTDGAVWLELGSTATVRIHMSLTDAQTENGGALANAADPTLAEVTAWASGNSVVDTLVYYTGTDTPTDPSTHIYSIDAAGAVTEIEDPDNYNRAFLSATLVAAVTPTSPLLSEIQAAVTANLYTNRLVYYTGTDTSTDSPTHVYWADDSGTVTLVKEPSASANPITHITDAQVLAVGQVTPNTATIEEIKATASSLSLTDAVVYYTGTDTATDTILQRYYVDGAGEIIELGAGGGTSTVTTVTEVNLESNLVGIVGPAEGDLALVKWPRSCWIYNASSWKRVSQSFYQQRFVTANSLAPSMDFSLSAFYEANVFGGSAPVTVNMGTPTIDSDVPVMYIRLNNGNSVAATYSFPTNRWFKSDGSPIGDIIVPAGRQFEMVFVNGKPETGSTSSSNMMLIADNVFQESVSLNNRAHLTATTVAAAIVEDPTFAEIQTAATAASLTNVLVYYTGTDIDTDAETRVYDVDNSGKVTLIWAAEKRGLPHIFLSSTDVGAGSPASPLLSEIQAAVTAQSITGSLVYYTGTDVDTDPNIFIYSVDPDGVALVIDSVTATELTATRVDSSGGAIVETLTPSTNTGQVRLFVNTNVDNDASLTVAAGETLNGVVDATFGFSVYGVGTQFRADEVDGGWAVSVVGAYSAMGRNYKTVPLTEITRTDGGGTITYTGSSNPAGSSISLVGVEYFDEGSTRRIYLHYWEQDDDLISLDLGTTLVPAGATVKGGYIISGPSSATRSGGATLGTVAGQPSQVSLDRADVVDGDVEWIAVIEVDLTGSGFEGRVVLAGVNATSAGMVAVHLTQTDVGAANILYPTLAQIQSVVTAQGLKNRWVYYTGDDVANLENATHVYWVEAAGSAILVKEPESNYSFINGIANIPSAGQGNTGDVIYVKSLGSTIAYIGGAWTYTHGAKGNGLTAQLVESFQTITDSDVTGDLNNAFAWKLLLTSGIGPRNINQFNSLPTAPCVVRIDIENTNAAATDITWNPAFVDGSGKALGTETIAPNTSQTLLFMFDPGSSKLRDISRAPEAAPSNATIELVNQVGHGFVAGEAVRVTGGVWVKAQGDNGSTTAHGVVSEVTDADNMVVTTFGVATITGHGLTVDDVYWLDQTTAGALTDTTPPSGVVQAILHVRDANTVFVSIGIPALNA